MEKVRTNILEKNIMTVRKALEISNTGDTSMVDEVISPNYFNHESQVDPARSKLRGPEEFIDTVILRYQSNQIFLLQKSLQNIHKKF